MSLKTEKNKVPNRIILAQLLTSIISYAVMITLVSFLAAKSLHLQINGAQAALLIMLCYILTGRFSDINNDIMDYVSDDPVSAETLEKPGMFQLTSNILSCIIYASVYLFSLFLSFLA